MRLSNYPGFLPGLILTIVLAFVLAGRLARALKIPPVVAWGLMFGLGIVVSATLTPSGDAIRFGEVGRGSCDLGRLGLAPLGEVLRFGETGLNIVLFIPLGLSLGLLPRSRAKAALMASAVALPLIIEGIQLVALPLARKCQSADVIDNLTGLAIGLLIGGIVGAVAGARTGTRAS